MQHDDRFADRTTRLSLRLLGLPCKLFPALSDFVIFVFECERLCDSGLMLQHRLEDAVILWHGLCSDYLLLDLGKDMQSLKRLKFPGSTE